ncbi:MAG: PKD domain-containing protein [Bernardetiaceae bacterium]|nr:PKD domain-containing protein [Bernardetiaceae bacterium]
MACQKQEATPPPVAEFDVVNDNCVAPCDMFFAANSPGATSFAWDFGGGRNATGRAVRQNFRTPGKPTVRLTVSGEGGTATADREVTVRQAVVSGSYVFMAGNQTEPPRDLAMTETVFRVQVAGNNRVVNIQGRVVVNNVPANLALSFVLTSLRPQTVRTPELTAVFSASNFFYQASRNTAGSSAQLVIEQLTEDEFSGTWSGTLVDTRNRATVTITNGRFLGRLAE